MNLCALGNKHAGYAGKEQTMEMKRRLVRDFLDIIGHFKKDYSCVGRSDVACRLSSVCLGPERGYRKGFVDRQTMRGATPEEASEQFKLWVKSCMDSFYGPLHPRMQIPEKAESKKRRRA